MKRIMILSLLCSLLVNPLVAKAKVWGLSVDDQSTGPTFPTLPLMITNTAGENAQPMVEIGFSLNELCPPLMTVTPSDAAAPTPTNDDAELQDGCPRETGWY